MTDAAFAALAAELVRLRAPAVLHVAQEPVSADGPAAARRRLLAGLDYADLGERWQPIDAATAVDGLTWLLAHDLAYGAGLADRDEAARLARAFVAALGPGAWSTNGALLPTLAAHLRAGTTPGTWSAGWTPLSGATFDAGVLFVGADRVAIAWAEDED